MKLDTIAELFFLYGFMVLNKLNQYLRYNFDINSWIKCYSSPYVSFFNTKKESD